MKKLTFALLTVVFTGFCTTVMAADLMVASTMQRCSTNQECALVTNSCADNCGFVPVNKTNLPALETLYQSRCGKAMSANPKCNMNPPMAAACINARCTIDYAYANNAGPKDYQSGAYPVPEAAVPSKVPGDYSRVDDKSGNFTAYSLPQESVKQETVGQITTKVYVPPAAPVSGGNYVPLGGGAVAPPAAAPAPIPPTVVAPQPAAAPVIPPVAVPSTSTHSTPPVMTPSRPNQLPPDAYVPAQTPPTIPAPGLPAAPVAATATPAVPAVGATGIPQAPAGSTPIPPSDLKPAPTFVPPAGTAIPVSPEDPGAPPPEGTTMMMKLPEGGTAAVGDSTRKGFQAAKPKTTVYN